MNNFFPLKIAINYLGFKVQDRFTTIMSVISVIGITLGVAALFAVISIMNGFRIELSNNIIGLNGDINIFPKDKYIENYQEVESNIKNKYDFINDITPVITGQGFIIGKRNNSGGIIRGLSKKDFGKKRILVENIKFGSKDIFKSELTTKNNIENNAENNGENNTEDNRDAKNIDNKVEVLIGQDLAANLGVFVGDKIKIFSPNFSSTLFGNIPRSQNFYIKGIFKTSMIDYDAGTIIMDSNIARRFLKLPNDSVSLLEIKTNNNQKVEEYNKILSRDFPNLYINNWRNANSQLLNALQVEKVAMFLILMIIIIVALFNMLSSLFMLVRDKNKDIAIFKTMGASDNNIRCIFIYTGLFIALMGVIFGLSLGYLFLININNIKIFLENMFNINLFDPSIYFLKELPSAINIMDGIYIGILTIIMGFISTLYPAYRASRVNIIDLLKEE